MATKKKATGGRLNRSEVVSVRLDPRVHFGAELAAVRQRRTLSSLIECAIDAYLGQVNAGPDNLTVEKVVHEVWSADPAERLVELAFRYPHLLSHDQQLMWDTICSYGPLWTGYWAGNFWTYYTRKASLLEPRLQELWPKLEAVAAGEMRLSELPKYRAEEFIKQIFPYGAGKRGVRRRSFDVTWLTPEEKRHINEDSLPNLSYNDDGQLEREEEEEDDE